MTRLTLLSLLLLTCLTGSAFGQSSYEERRAELRQQQETTRSEIESIESQIETYRSRVENATRRYDEMDRQYEELRQLIELQDERIHIMEQEQRQISEEMELIRENIHQLETELHELLERHKNTLIYLYKHGRTTELALILTSDSINQLLVRSYYLLKFDEYREDHEKEIREKQGEFELAREDLEETGQRNEESLAQIQYDKEELAAREEEQKRNIELLWNEREQYEAQLAQREQEREQMVESLNAILEEEENIARAEEERQRQLAEAEQIEDDREREAAIARYSQPIARSATVSDEVLQTFEASFLESRGQLPWPVESGVVTERFGERVHPVFSTRTNNPGIDIAVPARSLVQTVHDGYVFEIQPITGFGNIVIVNHGRYKTVYGNLSDIFVSRGNILSRGDAIGLSGDENSIRGEVLFFLIRDGSNMVNPESWIQSPTP